MFENISYYRKQPRLEENLYKPGPNGWGSQQSIHIPRDKICWYASQCILSCEDFGIN